MPQRGQEHPIVAPDLGLITGVPFHAIPDKGWSAALNMRYRLGNAQKVPGFVKVQTGALDSAVMGLYNFLTSTGYSFWIAATLHKVWKMGPADATFVDISGGNDIGGVNNQDLVSMTNYRDQLIITNGRTAPWVTTAPGGTIANIALLAGSPPKAKGVTVFQNHVLLWDIDPYGTPAHQTFQWSDLGSSTTWTPVSSNEAGSLVLADEPSGILTCVRLRDSLMVYKKDAVYLVDYTGFPFTMSERRLMSGAGPVNQWSVVNVKDTHYFPSTDKNVYRLTLFGPEDVAPQVRFGIFNIDLNWGAIANVFCFLNDADNEIYFAIPNGANTLPGLAYMLEYLESKWGRRDFGPINNKVTCFTPSCAQLLSALSWGGVTTPWSAQTATWASTQITLGGPVILMGDSAGFVYQYTSGQVDCAGTAMVVQGDTKYHDFGDALRNKRLSRLGIHYNAAAGTTLTVYVLTTQNPGITPTVSPAYTIVLDGTGRQWLDMDITARFFAFRFYNNSLGQTFNLTGYVPVVYVREVGGAGEEVT